MSSGKIGLWPELVFDSYKDTLATVHMWTQIVGKIRLRQWPWLNHSWHVTLYVSARGLSTGSIPYSGGIFQLEFDFINHQLVLGSSNGMQQTVKLHSISVAEFYHEVFDKLRLMCISVDITAVPNEVEVAVPFQQDTARRVYDPEQMHNLWQALIRVDTVFNRFRARFTGKCSPVHFFWGSFDLAVTRFSGRKAPLHSGGAPNMPLRVMQEAYSHEVSSCGFWPGGPAYPYPAFYAYCYPVPDDFGKQKILPPEAGFSNEMGEFLLNYEVVRTADDPEKVLLDFMQSTYVAAANTGFWDRQALECDLSGFEHKGIA